MSTRTRDEHDHGPAARLLDPVWCTTCAHDHIATIPVVTYRCYPRCGFGAWGLPVAEAHASTYPDHIVTPVMHTVVPIP